MTWLSGLSVAVATAVSVVAGAAAANTVTFDGIDDFDSLMIDGGTGSPYVEDGITVASTTPWGFLASDDRSGAAHLDDSGTEFASGVVITTGTIFDVLSFSFESLGFDFFDEQRRVVGNILLTGFLNGAEVVRDHVTMSPVAGTFQTVLLDAAFAGLDTFVIEILYPANGTNCGAPCGHINLDEVVLSDLPIAPVPLPASGLLLGAAALGLGALGRRRRG